MKKKNEINPKIKFRYKNYNIVIQHIKKAKYFHTYVNENDDTGAWLVRPNNRQSYGSAKECLIEGKKIIDLMIKAKKPLKIIKYRNCLISISRPFMSFMDADFKEIRDIEITIGDTLIFMHSFYPKNRNRIINNMKRIIDNELNKISIHPKRCNECGGVIEKR